MNRPIHVADYWKLAQIADVATSAGGATALTIRTNCQERNERASAVWLLSSDGAQRRLLSTPTALEEQPRWSPDGSRLAVTTAESPRHRRSVQLVDPAGNARRDIMSGVGVAHSAAWSPDGKTLCCAVGVPYDQLAVAAESAWYERHPAAWRPEPLLRLTSLRASGLVGQRRDAVRGRRARR